MCLLFMKLSISCAVKVARFGKLFRMSHRKSYPFWETHIADKVTKYIDTCNYITGKFSRFFSRQEFSLCTGEKKLRAEKIVPSAGVKIATCGSASRDASHSLTRRVDFQKLHVVFSTATRSYFQPRASHARNDT